MRSNSVAKVAIGILLVACCVVAVGAVVPRQRSPREDVPQTKTFSEKADEAEKIDVRQDGPAPTIISQVRMGPVKLVPVQDGIEVRIEAKFIETRLGFKYLWEADVFHAKTGVRLIHRPYIDQMFAGDEIEGAVITFTDQFRLRPDEYRVRVSLYRIPPDFAVESLSKMEAEQDHCVLRSIQGIATNK